MSRVARGHVEQLPSGSFRVHVYAGTDPLTRRAIRFKSTVKTEQQAHIELGRLLKEASEGRIPESGATMTKLLDEYAAIAQWDISTRQTNEELSAAPSSPPWATSRYGRSAAALAVVVLSRSLALTVLLLLPAGVAWIAFLSNINAALQLFLPQWVRARGLSAYQMVLFGGQAAGAALWVGVAAVAGLVPAFLISAAVMAAGAATIRFWPLYKIEGQDRSLVRWPEPHLLIDTDRDGPVLVRTTYTIAAAKEPQFLQAMARLRRSRLRTGATGWGLYQDGQNPRLFIELFTVPSWEEHLRQHDERQTGTDLEYHDAAAALSDPRPHTDHYLAADVGQ